MARPRPKILVVEDQPQLLDFFLIALGGRDYDVSCATNGRTALEMARTLRPDALIVSYKTPVIDGLDLLGRLRADPETASLKVILCSALKELRDRAAASGHAQDVLGVPFAKAELVEKVERLLT